MFTDRSDAGRRLADELRYLRGEDVVVLGLPRGGVPVAFAVAAGLGAPLDVIVVRKLGVPFQPELGFGAVGEDGARIIDDRVVAAAGLTQREISAVEARERAELDRRVRRLRAGRPRVPLNGRTAIVVDDGIATGSTARAACQVARAQGAKRVVLAVPVGPPGVIASLRRDADEVMCLSTPKMLAAISVWYAEFTQTRDDEVVALLKRAAARAYGSGAAGGTAGTAGSAAPDPPGFERELASVRAPTLLIVGGNDKTTLDLNRQAQQQLTCDNQLAIIPGATHLFEEPGALEQVAELAAGWFTRHLAAQAAGTVPSA